MKENKKLVSEIISDIRHDMTDEDILHLLAESKISVNTAKEQEKSVSFGQRSADAIAKFAGSWAFIFSFVGVLFGWMITNIVMATAAFDQEEKDRLRAENDYKVNLKTEIMIGDIHDKLVKVLAREEQILKILEEQSATDKKK